MKSLHKITFMLFIGSVVMFCASLTTAAQNLERRAFLGVSSVTLNDSLRMLADYTGTTGVYVTALHRGGSGGEAGIREGDVITSINDTDIASPQELVQVMQSLHEGNILNVTYYRSGEEFSQTVTARTWPGPENYDNTYLEVPFDGGYLRAVLSTPRDVVNPPVVYFIQGIGCGSIYYLQSYHPYKRIPEQFIEAGYAVFYVEKPGAGDSKATPSCEEIGFIYELDAFREGYRFLKTLGGIDTDNVYIFGHSFGGIHAPILAGEFHPRGVIVYGTALRGWMDYLIELHRYQGVWTGGDYAEIDDALHDIRRTYYQLFYNNRSPRELYTEEPYRTVLQQRLGYQGEGNTIIGGRHYRFHVEAHETNLARHWRNTHARVLAIYGEADIEALYPYDHERIAELVNHYRPGTAEFWLYPETDHSLVKVGSLMDGWKIRSQGNYAQAVQELYNEQVIRDVIEWMRKENDYKNYPEGK
jgi:uncharacterized protein